MERLEVKRRDKPQEPARRAAAGQPRTWADVPNWCLGLELVPDAPTPGEAPPDPDGLAAIVGPKMAAELWAHQQTRNMVEEWFRVFAPHLDPSKRRPVEARRELRHERQRRLEARGRVTDRQREQWAKEDQRDRERIAWRDHRIRPWELRAAGGSSSWPSVEALRAPGA